MRSIAENSKKSVNDSTNNLVEEADSSNDDDHTGPINFERKRVMKLSDVN
jgi:hypothetical protein